MISSPNALPSTSFISIPSSLAIVGATSTLRMISKFVPGLIPAPAAINVACM